MPHRPPPNALSFKRRLLRWFRSDGRDLPWRRTRDPYRILVSEFMLQQTQVSRVAEFYPRFLDRFPTIESLAKAPPRQVRESWDGLGYYRRAANLHRVARVVVEEHGGAVPSDPTQLTCLPGIGRYTAGAVVSFAYEKRAAAVDTNIARVLRRAFRFRRTKRAGRQRGRADTRTTWELAELLLPKHRRTAWEFNQALMDLGARYCTARSPKCSTCPVRRACHNGSRIL